METQLYEHKKKLASLPKSERIKYLLHHELPTGDDKLFHDTTLYIQGLLDDAPQLPISTTMNPIYIHQLYAYKYMIPPDTEPIIQLERMFFESRFPHEEIEINFKGLTRTDVGLCYDNFKLTIFSENDTVKVLLVLYQGKIKLLLTSDDFSRYQKTGNDFQMIFNDINVVLQYSKEVVAPLNLNRQLIELYKVKPKRYVNVLQPKQFVKILANRSSAYPFELKMQNGYFFIMQRAATFITPVSLNFVLLKDNSIAYLVMSDIRIQIPHIDRILLTNDEHLSKINPSVYEDTNNHIERFKMISRDRFEDLKVQAYFIALHRATLILRKHKFSQFDNLFFWLNSSTAINESKFLRKLREKGEYFFWMILAHSLKSRSSMTMDLHDEDKQIPVTSSKVKQRSLLSDCFVEESQ
jgi:hypothetical protein